MVTPEKAHATGKFVVVMQNGGCTLLYLASTLATVVRQEDKQIWADRQAGRQAGREAGRRAGGRVGGRAGGRAGRQAGR